MNTHEVLLFAWGFLLGWGLRNLIFLKKYKKISETNEQIRMEAYLKAVQGLEVIYRKYNITKEDAFKYAEFKADYMRIDAMNLNQEVGNSITTKPPAENIIWEAFIKGEQLKRYYEK